MSSTSRNPIPVLGFDGPVAGFAANYIGRNGWKLAATHEREDLMQEAFLTYAKVADAYPGIEDEPHFFSLFKTAWHRRFLDLAAENSRGRRFVVSLDATARGSDDEERPRHDEPAGELDNAGSVAALLRSAPSEVLLILQMFLNAPQELLELAFSSWNPHGRSEHGGSDRINRMLGFPDGYDAVGAVYDHFGVSRV